jgi:hypothetical protein
MWPCDLRSARSRDYSASVLPLAEWPRKLLPPRHEGRADRLISGIVAKRLTYPDSSAAVDQE